jgi:hypothetical protein
MACPRGYQGRHTGLYRDTEGKQPTAPNLPGSAACLVGGCGPKGLFPQRFGHALVRPGAAAGSRPGDRDESPGYTRSIAGRPPRAQSARLGSFKG